jgi:hypothetical protein
VVFGAVLPNAALLLALDRWPYAITTIERDGPLPMPVIIITIITEAITGTIPIVFIIKFCVRMSY